MLATCTTYTYYLVTAYYVLLIRILMLATYTCTYYLYLLLTTYACHVYDAYLLLSDYVLLLLTADYVPRTAY